MDLGQSATMFQLSDRMRRRVLAHHLPLFLISAICVCALYATRSYRDVLSRASFATAYPALILLAATLLVGPWNVLRRQRNPVSSDLRRDLGIWAGILSMLHAAVGQNVHLRGRPWLYYVYEHRERHVFPLRHDLFGFANYSGALGTLLVIVLLAMSNDWSLRALGTPQWKQFQRWNYFAFSLAAAHSVAYQWNEKQQTPFVVAVLVCIAITAGLQLAGFVMRRTDKLKHS
jgi:sulfoxide reductase heme-binding subunit YedZ